MDRVALAAAAIAQTRRAGTLLAPLPEPLRPADLTEGYRVQDAVHAILRGAGHGAIVGYKIGATTPVMQQYMKIDHPCAGGIFAASVHASGARLKYSDFRRVGIECEVAARLGRDLRPEDAPFDRHSIASAVECYMAAVELVDDRYVDWPSLGTPTLAADDFFGAGSVLGPPVAPGDAPDLVAAAGRTLVNGVEFGSGHGVDVMGHPLEALAWLANNLAARGQTLGKGQFVSTGSLVKTYWAAPGDRVRIEVEGLGDVELTIAAG